jgi:uncharacterized protein YneF (UPF0154 family)
MKMISITGVVLLVILGIILGFILGFRASSYVITRYVSAHPSIDEMEFWADFKDWKP